MEIFYQDIDLSHSAVWRFFDRIARYRPIICRGKYAAHPDVGFNVCRLPPETFEILGIEPGDRVMIRSEHGHTTVKALRINREMRERRHRQIEHKPG